MVAFWRGVRSDHIRLTARWRRRPASRIYSHRMQDLIVIGAGLSGLAVARGAAAAGLSVRVLEARGRIGGRVLSHRTPAGAYDLGPAWIWPTMQPRVAALAWSAGLALREQAEQGGFLFQDAAGRTRRLAHGFPQEPPSMRVVGGISAMVEATAAAVPEGTVLTGHAATRIALTDAGVAVTAQAAGSETTFEAARAVLALPPRLISGLGFTPALPAPARAALAAVPGWMAGQAKALAIYERPFWREAGLSGSAFSDAGPLGEMHDATLPGAAEGALFGFLAWPPALREARREALPGLVARQLAALFGPEAANPRELVIQDWSREAFTATPADQDIPEAHPEYRKLALPPPWHGRVLLAGAEMAPEFGGYLEGALAAAEAALDALALTRPGGPAAR